MAGRGWRGVGWRRAWGKTLGWGGVGGEDLGGGKEREMGTQHGNENDKVNLDERTVVKRVNRFLAQKGFKLCKNRPARKVAGSKTDRIRQLGTWYIVKGGRGGAVVEKHVDLEKFARRNEIIASYEVLAAE